MIAQNRMNPKSTWLLKHARNENSQFGEDGILAKAFATIGKRNSWCVEAGAWDGKYLSNTHALLNKGWSGVFIEGNPEKFPALQNTYEGNRNAHLLSALVGAGVDDGLNHLLAKTPIPREFDLLSLDIDGLDYYVWQALTRYRPRIVVVEFNPTVPNDVVFVQDRDASLNQGCSLLALIRLGKEKGYELIAATDVNGIFVIKEDFHWFGIRDNSIDAMHFAKHSARVFQGYDGTIFTAGMPCLHWSQRKIGFEDFQVLPRDQRRFGDAPPLKADSR
ncbi:hypothetical protein [Methylocapsa aurea]|uniref:hypothetical protein n=1 Tax=Methylocapsa aurea TaxID=663610 RepID=UPI00068B6385|nr:hypothetical protein [Methylocapsa aurea]